MPPISKVFNRDCMEAMREFPDKFFELAIVDPPYGIASQQKRGVGSRIDKSGKMNNWNNSIPDEVYFDELFRVSKGQIIWGANNYAGLPPTEYFCIWNKKQSVENFASAEYAWISQSVGKPAKIFDFGIHAHNSSISRIHPTQKPIELYKWLLINYAKPGDKIVDTHLGSGSSRIAAWDMGFDFWGYEIDSDYFGDHEKRFQTHISKPVLFAPEQMYNFEQKRLFEDAI